MKMYKKSDLNLVNGMLVAESGDIVMPDLRIVKQANDFETIIQQAAFLEDQPEATPMPSLKGFERVSINDREDTFTASTPMLDKQAARTMAMMEELDDIDIVNKANKMVADFKLLIDFIANDYVIDCGGDIVMPFDTPVFGDVLKLTKDEVIAFIAHVCGLCNNDLCDACPNDDDEDKHPRRGMVTVPATKENLDKIMEFFDEISKSDDEKSEDEGSEE